MEGFISKYRRFASGVTDAPAEFHDYVARVALATALGDAVSIRLGEREVRPNLWVLLVAPTSLHRKTTAIVLGARLLESAFDNVLLPSHLAPDDLPDALCDNPTGLFVFPEWRRCARLLGRVRRSGSLSLAELYDPPALRDLRLGRGRDTAVGVLTEVSPGGLLATISAAEADLSNFLLVPASAKERVLLVPGEPDEKLRDHLIGWLSRLAGPEQREPSPESEYERAARLWAAIENEPDEEEDEEWQDPDESETEDAEASPEPVVEPVEEPEPEPEPKPEVDDALALELEKVAEASGPAVLSGEGSKRFEHWSGVFHDLATKAEDARLVPFYARMPVHLLKLALIERASAGEAGEIGPEMVDIAGDLCIKQAARARQLFTEDLDAHRQQSMLEKVLKALPPGKVVKRMDLYRTLRMPVAEFDLALALLVEDKTILTENAAGGGRGRPGTLYMRDPGVPNPHTNHFLPFSAGAVSAENSDT